MRPSPNPLIERHRIDGPRGQNYGRFIFLKNGAELRVIASDGTDEIPWDHVSVSLPNRCPTWEEMQFLKEIFWLDTETVVQFHPRRSDYKNLHPYCLHMWKPHFVDLSLPPNIAV